MNNAQLEAAIKLNADQFNATLKKVGVRLQELSGLIESLPSGDKQLNRLSREFTQLSATQQKLIDGYNKLGTESENTAPKLQKTSDSSKTARTALTSLSLTLQDLPFGFIGVQNNLPGVIQGFGNLASSTNGKLIPALKAIKDSLLGPAGIFLAFSGATAGVTYLIKEYGSLSAGIDALIGKTYNYTKALNEAQKSETEFAKSVRDISELQNDASGSYQASAIKLQTLTEIVLDATRSDKERKNALLQLKELDKERFKNFSIEKNALEGLQAATDAYTQSIINNAVIKEYESEIGKVTVNLNRQRDALFLLQKEFDKLNQDYPQLAEQAAKFQDKLKIIPGQYAALPNILDKNNSRISEYISLQQKLIAQEKIVTDVEFARYSQLEKELKGAIELSNELYTPKQNIKGKAPKIRPEQFFAYLPEESDFVKELKKRLDRFSKIQEEYLTRQRLYVTDVGGPMANNLKNPFAPDMEDIKLFDNYLLELTKLFDKRSKQIGSIISGFIQQPLSQLFDMLLTKGRSSWQEFGQIVIGVLKRIATEIVTSTIVKVLSSILAPGSSAAISTLLKGFSTASLGEFLSNTPGQANFGGLSGGFGMTGQVVFVQRGSDLVGVLNRTNETINRVG